ncbi:TPA: hypothetical protein L7O76_004558 [Klebsiella pneumoniae]|nr:hypothetical protein [Klebsiella pneumoniae]
MMVYYIWNGLLIVITIGLPILLMFASNGAQPTFLSGREMRARYGTPQKKQKDINST